MRISKEALDAVGLTIDDFYNWCAENNKQSDRKRVREEFFRKILEGKIYVDSSTYKIVTKYRRK